MRPRLDLFCPAETDRPQSRLAGALATGLAQTFELSIYRGRHDPEPAAWARRFPVAHATAYAQARQLHGDAPRLFLLCDDAYLGEGLIPPLLRFGGAAYFLDASFNRLAQTITIYRGEPELFVERMRAAHGVLGEQSARATIEGRGRTDWFDQFDLLPPLARATALAWAPTLSLRLRLRALGRSAQLLPIPAEPSPHEPEPVLAIHDAESDADLEALLAGLGPEPGQPLRLIAPAWRHERIRALLRARAFDLRDERIELVPGRIMVDLRRGGGFEIQHQRHRAIAAGSVLALIDDPVSAHLPEGTLVRAADPGRLGATLAALDPARLDQIGARARSFAAGALAVDRIIDRMSLGLLEARDGLLEHARRWERHAQIENRRLHRRLVAGAVARVAGAGDPAAAQRAAAELGLLAPPGLGRLSEPPGRVRRDRPK
jgi:hypothetical protein